MQPCEALVTTFLRPYWGKQTQPLVHEFVTGLECYLNPNQTFGTFDGNSTTRGRDILEHLERWHSAGCTRPYTNTDSQKVVLAYLLHLLTHPWYTTITDGLRFEFSPERKILGVATSDFLNIPSCEDPIQGKVFDPSYFAKEILKAMEKATRNNPYNNEDFFPFRTMFFITDWEDQAFALNAPQLHAQCPTLKFPFYGTTGAAFVDIAQARLAAIFGPAALRVISLCGIPETVEHETHPFHVFKPWGLLKEGGTEFSIGRFLPGNYARYKIDRCDTYPLPAPRDLVYEWDNHPDYYAAFLFFLSLGIRLEGDNQFNPLNFSKYQKRVQKLLETIYKILTTPEELTNPQVYAPLLADLCNFRDVEEMFQFINRIFQGLDVAFRSARNFG